MVATAERPAPKVRQPFSKKGSVALTVAILGFLFVLYLLHKVDWTEPPVYPGAKILTSYKDFGNNIKQTVLVSTDELDKVSLGYSSLLGENHWYREIIGSYNQNFVLDDDSKTFSIFDYNFLHTQCSAFFLNVNYEEMSDHLTKITVSEFVGPCGSKFK